MTDQPQYTLTLRLDGADPQYELIVDDDCKTLMSDDPDYIASALKIGFQMTEEQAAAAMARAVPRSETYTISKGMPSALPAMVLLHAWGVATMRLAVYHRGRCQQKDGRPIMLCHGSQGLPQTPLVCPNCGALVTGEEELAFHFTLEAKD
jgi:hypothetical protein